MWRADDGRAAETGAASTLTIEAPALVLELGQASVKLTEAGEKARSIGLPHNKLANMHRNATHSAPSLHPSEPALGHRRLQGI